MKNFMSKLLTQGVEMVVRPGEMNNMLLVEFRKTGKKEVKFKQNFWLDILAVEENELVTILEEELESFERFYKCQRGN